MFRDPTQEDKQNPKRYLRDVDDTYVFDITTGLYKPKSYNEEFYTSDKKPGSHKRFPLFVNPKRDWLTIIVSLLTLIVVGLYTHYARLQWQEAKRTAGQSIISAAAAKSAAETAHNTLINEQKIFEINQRPYMVAQSPLFIGRGPIPDAGIQANITFQNIGKTPAIRYIINIDLLPYEPLPRPQGTAKLRKFMTDAFSKLEMQNALGRKEVEDAGAGEDVAPDATNFVTSDQVVIPAQNFPKLQAGQLSLFYIGVVSYTDAYKHPYQTEFCWYYVGMIPSVWHICDTHNTIK
jgi:hypothetical protein